MVQNMFVRFDKNGVPHYKFDADDLREGETDGSSYNNGGMRATHTAGGYLKIVRTQDPRSAACRRLTQAMPRAQDPTSPIFLRQDTIFIPACFCSWYGDALDEKTPLLRASQALSEQGTRMLGLMGFETSGIVSNIGLEQEMFLIPRTAFYKRPDLQMTGRTLLGCALPTRCALHPRFLGCADTRLALGDAGACPRVARRCRTTTWARRPWPPRPSSSSRTCRQIAWRSASL